jgi:hypothetical protein
VQIRRVQKNRFILPRLLFEFEDQKFLQDRFLKHSSSFESKKLSLSLSLSLSLFLVFENVEVTLKLNKYRVRAGDIRILKLCKSQTLK